MYLLASFIVQDLLASFHYEDASFSGLKWPMVWTGTFSKKVTIYSWSTFFRPSLEFLTAICSENFTIAKVNTWDVEVVRIWLLKSYVSLGYRVIKIKVSQNLQQYFHFENCRLKEKSQNLQLSIIKLRIFKPNLLFHIL